MSESSTLLWGQRPYCCFRTQWRNALPVKSSPISCSKLKSRSPLFLQNFIYMTKARVIVLAWALSSYSSVHLQHQDHEPLEGSSDVSPAWDSKGPSMTLGSGSVFAPGTESWRRLTVWWAEQREGGWRRTPHVHPFLGVSGNSGVSVPEIFFLAVLFPCLWHFLKRQEVGPSFIEI